MLPVFSQPEGRVFRRSGASLLGVPQPVTDPFRAALMRVFSSSSFYPDFYGIKTSEKKKIRLLVEKLEIQCQIEKGEKKYLKEDRNGFTCKSHSVV